MNPIQSTSGLETVWLSLEGLMKSKPDLLHSHLIREEVQGQAWVRLHVDPAGARCLLVPIGTEQSLDGLGCQGISPSRVLMQVDGAGHVMAKLACPDRGRWSVFNRLVMEVLNEPVSFQTPAVVVARILDGWRSFLAQAQTMGPSQALGLAGELTVLLHLLHADPEAIAMWEGPLGADHDFRHGSLAIEVKSTSVKLGIPIHVNGLTQLDPQPGVSLQVLFIRFARHSGPGAGMTIDEMAEAIRVLSGSPPGFEQLLQRAGWGDEAKAKHGSMRFEPLEMLSAVVDDQFPRLTRKMVDGTPFLACVRTVDYTIDAPQGVFARTGSESFKAFVLGHNP